MLRGERLAVFILFGGYAVLMIGLILLVGLP
jgi:hypothetical protein